MLNANIIMQGRAPDVVGSLDRGAIAGQRVRMMNDQNALNQYVGQNGANILAGDQNALNGLSGFGVAGLDAAQGVQGNILSQQQTQLGMDATRQNMQATSQRMRILDEQQAAAIRQEAAALSAQELAQQQAQMERAIAIMSSANDPATWDALAQQHMPEMIGQFAQKPALVASIMDIQDVLAMNAPPSRMDEIAQARAEIGLQADQANLDALQNPVVDPMDQIALDQAQINLDIDRTKLAQLQSPAPDPNATFENSTALRKEWNSNASVKAFATQVAAFGRMNASAANPSAAGDLSMIFNYMKVLDPGSTVREGEFATAQQAGSIDQRVWGLYNQVVSGQRLTPEQRQDFFSRAEMLYGNAENEYSALYEQYANIAAKNNLPLDEALIDYRYAGTQTPPSGPSSGGGQVLTYDPATGTFK